MTFVITVYTRINKQKACSSCVITIFSLHKKYLSTYKLQKINEITMVNASVVGMSARSTRRGTVNSMTNHSRRSSKKNSEANVHSYDIYCVNFYDTGLNAVRDAFIEQIKDGLRRSIFIIDLDKELEDAHIANSLLERSSVRKLNSKSTIFNFSSEGTKIFFHLRLTAGRSDRFDYDAN